MMRRPTPGGGFLVGGQIDTTGLGIFDNRQPYLRILFDKG